MGITNLPAELVVKILSNLDFTDITACRYVNRRWQALIDRSHLQALAFSRSFCFQPIPQTVQHYNSFTRGWLASFSDRAKEFVEGLDTLLKHRYFPEMLFFAIAVVLSETTLLTCQNVYTIRHFGRVANATFSPDGRHLATASADNTAKIWELVAGQWQEKASICHSNWVTKVIFSPDGSHLVTTSDDHTAKIWGLAAGQWEEIDTLRHPAPVFSVNFSPDGCHLVTTSADNTVRVWGGVDRDWHEKATIRHLGWVRDASFSPDGSHLVTASDDNTAKIWLIKGKRSNDIP